VKEGHLGVKSGQGFYAYEKGSKELKAAPQFAKNNQTLENQ
jgi:3-hydroxyacyl-CoA dehydrogenase